MTGRLPSDTLWKPTFFLFTVVQYWEWDDLWETFRLTQLIDTVKNVIDVLNTQIVRQTNKNTVDIRWQQWLLYPNNLLTNDRRIFLSDLSMECKRIHRRLYWHYSNVRTRMYALSRFVRPFQLGACQLSTAVCAPLGANFWKISKNWLFPT